MDILEVEGAIPVVVSNNSILSITRNRKKEIHSIGGHPARFISEIPRWAIEKYAKKGDTILDPFCGSGTTLIEGRHYGCNVIGIDNNPVARLISSVKCKNIDEKNVKKKLNEISKKVRSAFGDDVELPYVTNRDFWFDVPVSQCLMKIRNAINEIAKDDIRDVFLVCFSDTIRPVSHVAPGQILQARRPNNHEQKSLTENEVLATFEKKCNEILKLLKTDYSKHTSLDVLTPSDDLPEFDMVVTSPPYINAVDYIWAYKLRMEWLGFVSSSKERLNLSSKEIGTERILKTEYVEVFQTGISELDTKLEEIRNAVHYKAGKGQNELRAQVTYKYFIEMDNHLSTISNRMKKGSKYCMVIGDSNICKTYIPTSEYIISYANEHGLRKLNHYSVLLKNRTLNISRDLDWADKIDFDQVIVFEKS